MKKVTIHFAWFLVALLLISACKQAENTDLKDSLTFFLSFDEGFNADYAKGDPNIYTVPSRQQLDQVVVGMHQPAHEIIEDAGKFGAAFRFGSKSDTTLFFKAKDNIAYDPSNWSGSISFWLSLDPAKDLEPGFTDPIQVTDTRWNDASIWVDFTRENPRDFRLGIIGDMTTWSQDTVGVPVDSVLARRRIAVDDPPFASASWTHIGITYEALGGDQNTFSLYLNGEKIGTVSNVNDPFTWDLDNAKIYLGLSFIGSMDELAIFNRPLSSEEIQAIYQLEGGIRSIL